MSKLNIVRRCIGCGTILQSANPSAPGYIQKEKLELTGSLFCEDCWKYEKYNSTPKEAHVDPNFFYVLDDAQASDSLIIYVIDLFSFEASFISAINKRINSCNILVVANKRDLLPKEVNNDELKEYVSHRLRVENLRVKDVILVSSTEGYNLEALLNKATELRKRHDVFVIGSNSAGKTSLIYDFLKAYHNNSDSNIVTANYPKTSLQVMQIPLDNSSKLYDLPGIGNDNSILSKVDSATKKIIIPNKTISARNFSLKKGSTLFVGGLARFDFIECEKVDVKAYFSSKVELDKHELRDPDVLFKKVLEKKKLIPTSSNYSTIKDFDIFEIEVTETGHRDIGVQGLGWISFIGKNQKIRVFVPKGVSIYTTRSKIK